MDIMHMTAQEDVVVEEKGQGLGPGQGHMDDEGAAAGVGAAGHDTTGVYPARPAVIPDPGVHLEAEVEATMTKKLKYCSGTIPRYLS